MSTEPSDTSSGSDSTESDAFGKDALAKDASETGALEYTAPSTSEEAASTTTAPRARTKTALLVSIAAIVSVVVPTVLVSTTIAQQDSFRDLFTVWGFTPSSTIEAYVERSEMSDKGEYFFLASEPIVASPTEFNDTCGTLEAGVGVLGCYVTGSQTIFLYDVTDERLDGVEEVVASHEMLHAVWDRMNGELRARIGDLLETEANALANDADFMELMAVYEQSEPGERLNELHAIIGTEIDEISPELEAHYGQFFVDRQTVVGLHVTSSAVLKDIEERTEILVAELDNLYIAIERDYKKYNSGYDKLNKDVDAFNTKNKNYGFTSQAQFDVARNALFARQAKLDKLYKSIVKRENTYDKKYAELEELDEQAASLNKQLNINERDSDL